MAHACLRDEATEAQRTKRLLWGHRGGWWWSWGLSDQGILFVSSLCPFTSFSSPAGSSSPQDALGWSRLAAPWPDPPPPPRQPGGPALRTYRNVSCLDFLDLFA